VKLLFNVALCMNLFVKHYLVGIADRQNEGVVACVESVGATVRVGLFREEVPIRAQLGLSGCQTSSSMV